MANSLYGYVIGPIRIGCVMQGFGGAHLIHSDAASESASGSGDDVEVFPTPDRGLLRVLRIEDGIEVNDKNSVRGNKLHWIICAILSKFPKRKFKGLNKYISQFEELEDWSLIDLDGVTQAIQRVVRYGGVYEDYITTLYAIWDGAATISDAAADIGINPDQWTQIIVAQGEIREINRVHNGVINSNHFKNETSKSAREEILDAHKRRLHNAKSLLLRLMTLNSIDLNPEINGDLDDFLEDISAGKRLCRRFKRAFYNALARECLRTLKEDPLKIYGNDANHIIYNMKKVCFSSIGEIKVGNKVYRVTDHSVITEDAKL